MLTNHINDLITAAINMRLQPGTDKKAINKTIARLEEAALWSEKILTPGAIADRVSLDKTGVCTCRPGLRDKACPVHS